MQATDIFRANNRQVDTSMYRKLDLDDVVAEQVQEDETPEHVHYGVDQTHALTLFESAADDPDYDGKPFECERCSETVDYHTCDECGDGFGSSEALAGHKSAHAESDDEGEN